MRVLLVSGSFPPMACGVGDYARALAAALSGREDVHVGVLTSAAADPAAAGGFEVFPVIRTWSPTELGRAKDVVRRFRPDVVHFQFPSQGHRGNLAWLLPPVLRLTGVPVVQTWHEAVAARWGGWAPAMSPTLGEKLRTAVPQAVLALVPGDIVVVRPDFARRLPRWYRVLPLRGRFHLVENASMIPRAELTAAERAEVRARYGRGKALLVFFGFFSEHKGIDDVLEIMDPARHHLVMIGGANEDDPYQRDLVRRVREPPLATRVTLAGFLPAVEVARVLAAADAVVLPYRQGGGSWNTTLGAAALQGSFVLTTSVERRGLDPERNVYFARPGDRGELKRALADNLGRRNDPPAPEAAGPTWAGIAERHLEIYRRAARPRPAPGGSAG